jgi:hypothetical protein
VQAVTDDVAEEGDAHQELPAEAIINHDEEGVAETLIQLLTEV